MEIWAEDEARFGLIPSTRRVWARRGHRPLASSRRRYEWGYLYGFVRPQNGQVVTVVGTTVSTDAMSVVLQHFAEQVGAGPRKQVVLVLDGAGWHAGNDLVVPEGIHLCFLPAYAPELQPAERLWPLINEVIANRAFRSLEDLVAAVDHRCRYLHENRDVVARLALFHWWPWEPKNLW